MTPPYMAALYMRLSKEDGTSESGSITNQKKLLCAYARDHDFPIVSVHIDDGYSGTNFNRPGFQALLNEIEEGKINLVLIKDLSRLGRDYIGTGQYTEFYFPSRHVRLIAVNDGYDSSEEASDLIPFKHVMNEMYARDASRKIRSSLKTRRKEGAFVGSFPPYGYRRDPNDRHHLVPDQATSCHVQMIFSLAAKGMTPNQIAGRLNGLSILSPLAYRNEALTKTGSPGTSVPKTVWTSNTIVKILHHPAYLGHMAQGKSRKLSFKSTATLPVPQKDWIVVPHTHKPLIDEDTCLLAQRWLRTRSRPDTPGFFNLFSGAAFCAGCLSPMSTVRSGRDCACLACGLYKSKGKTACGNHLIPYADLEIIVLSQLRSQMPGVSIPRLSLPLVTATVDHILISQGTPLNCHAPRHQSIQIQFTPKSSAWQWALDVTQQGSWDAGLSTLPENV